MEPRERVDRMLEAGIITRQQAADLHASLGEGATSETISRRPSRLWIAIIGALCAGFVVLALVIVFTDGGRVEVVEDVARNMNQLGENAMYKGVSMVLAVALLLLVPLIMWAWLQNNLVTKEEAAYAAWAQVESNYQRRNDLIPALVETISRYIRHETQTLTGVTRERGAARAAYDRTVEALIAAQKDSAQRLEGLAGKPPSEDTEFEALAHSQDQVALGMRRLLAVAEDYPELRSADQFLELQAQLEGTENRINVSRMRFNDAVGSYNAAIRKLPGSLVASVAGFTRKAYFKADAGARDAKPLGID